MTEGHIIINWNEFESSAPSTIQQLWLDKHFTDVTLVSEDQTEIKAHKVILSSGSKFFKDILTNYSNPLIFLKGVRGHELNLLIKFIYLGKCQVQQEDLEHFLAAGKDLEINGLAGEITETDVELKTEVYSPEKSLMQESAECGMSTQIIENQNQTLHSETNELVKIKETDTEASFPTNTDAKEPKEQRTKVPEELAEQEHPLKKLTLEEVFPPEPTKKQIDSSPVTEPASNTHKNGMSEKSCQSKSQSVVRYSCDICDKTYCGKGNLEQHKNIMHDGRRIDCNMCDYQATRPSVLRLHKRYIHDGIGHECSMCYKKFQQANGLKLHITKHHQNIEN